MSHRKFERPRHGSLGFLPKKRAKSIFEISTSQKYSYSNVFPYINIFFGFKVGMTHITRISQRKSSRLFLKEVCDAVTIIETPQIIVSGLAGYSYTLNQFKKLKSIKVNNTLNKNKANLKVKEDKPLNLIKVFSKLMVSFCSQFRLECSIYNSKLYKKNRFFNSEIQILGGSIISRLEYGIKLLGKKLHINNVFQNNDMIDIVSITKGHGKQGVITRWGITRLPRKTHRGLRKVACIGPWSPSRVSWTVARAGQYGFHKRTEANKKIYKIGSSNDFSYLGTTTDDQTLKNINIMGGFIKYGLVKKDYILVKGSIGGTAKRPLLLRKSFSDVSKQALLEKIDIRFIDTSSNMGHGRYQTSSDKVLNYL